MRHEENKYNRTMGLRKMSKVILNNDKDRFIWLIKKDGVFTTQSLYKEIMKEERIGGNGIFWKTKIPLKIKIFLWYLKRGVVLTKDNLLKRRWKGDSKCKFCGLEETIQHPFFNCWVARFVWNLLIIAFNIIPPRSTTHMFGSWIRSFALGLRNQLMVGIAALCWALWLNRNDTVFQGSMANSYLQVIFRGHIGSGNGPCCLKRERDLERWMQADIWKEWHYSFLVARCGRAREE